MQHLDDCAYCINDLHLLNSKLEELLLNRATINNYAKLAREKGEKYHANDHSSKVLYQIINEIGGLNEDCSIK